MIAMGAQGNRAKLPGQVCSLLEAGSRVFSDPPLLGWRGCQRQQRALEEKLLPPSNSGQPLAREELLPSRHFLGVVASP